MRDPGDSNVGGSVRTRQSVNHVSGIHPGAKINPGGNFGCAADQQHPTTDQQGDANQDSHEGEHQLIVAGLGKAICNIGPSISRGRRHTESNLSKQPGEISALFHAYALQALVGGVQSQLNRLIYDLLASSRQ